MPTARIQNTNIATLSKDIDYDYGDETLSSLINKYDSKINSQNTNLVIGDTFFKDWNVPIEACLFYGDFISIHTHELVLNVQFDGKQKVIQMRANQTVKELQFEMELDFGVYFAEIKFRSDNYELADHSKTLKFYGLNNNSNIFVFDYKIDDVNQLNSAISIETQSKKILHFNLNNSTTIMKLKEKIQIETGVPLSDQRLVFNYRLLEEERRLQDYNIRTGSLLSLYLEQIGGGCSFADLCQQPTKIGWSKKAPKWCVAKIGLCLEGQCVNEECIAFNKMVIINMGVPIIFKLGLPSVDKPTDCPMCEEYVEPLTCAFNSCAYRYLAVKKTDKGLEKIKSEWVEVGSEYNRFDEDQQSDYSSLVIETKYSNWGNSSYSVTDDIDCKFCLSKKRNILEEDKSYFHQNCKDDYIRCMTY